MTSIDLLGGDRQLVLVGAANGVVRIPSPTPLTRLNYFDGKFLRADDLRAEQEYLRRLVGFSNEAGGAGVAYGLDTVVAGDDTIRIGSGLAIDPQGQVLLLPQAIAISIHELLDAARRVVDRPVSTTDDGGFGDCVVAVGAPSGTAVQATSLYLITIGHAEALCGEEDVFGKLCEDACVTSTDRPYRVEGVLVRARPLTLQTPLATSHAVTLSQTHLRSLVASAYFADERLAVGSLISGDGLRLDTWCLGARAAGGFDVPLAVLARSGQTTLFLDAWTARRERIEPPARRYWAWRMAMRPWDVFLAQVLQFQCQLHEVLLQVQVPGGRPPDPCSPQHAVLDEASQYLTVIEKQLSGAVLPANVETLDAPVVRPLLPGGFERLATLRQRIGAVLAAAVAAPSSRALVDGGIVELPSAGYLPVVPGSDVSVNEQVRKLVGEGLDLRFCVVRPDFVPHALEEAQHMERISLLQGVDDPARKPAVDVLVPDGEIVRRSRPSLGRGWDTHVRLLPSLVQPETSTFVRASFAATTEPVYGIDIHGAGRSEVGPAGGGAFHFAGATEARHVVRFADLIRGFASLADTGRGTQFGLLHEVATENATRKFQGVELSDLHLRSMTVAAHAMQYTRDQLAEEAPFAAPTRSREPEQMFKPPQRVSAEGRFVAMWLTMGCDRNPFDLSAGDSTPLHVLVHVAAPSTRPTVLTEQLRADFRVDQTLPALKGTRRVRGRLIGIGSSRSIVEGAAPHERGGPFDIPATITSGMGAGGAPWVELDIGDATHGFVYRIRAGWDGSPTQATIEVDLVHGERTFHFPLAALKADDGVLAAGNVVNTIARGALTTIGAALDDPGFAAASEVLLFEPRQAPLDELTVKATLDWVLFHRRRDKNCAVDTPTPAPPASRRYQVWEIEVADAEAAEAVRRALLQNAATLSRVTGFRQVDQVEFAGGRSDLVTSALALRLDWQAVQPGAVIQYAAIAGTLDGEALAKARLAAYETALVPAATVAQDAVAETLPQVPTPLASPGLDGIIVVVTRPQLAETCMTVYRRHPTSSIDGLVPPAIEGKLVAKVEFDESTGEVADSKGLVAAWRKAGDGIPDTATVVFHSGDTTAGTTETRSARARAILTAIGGDDVSVTEHEVPPSFQFPQGTCPAVLVVEPVIVCHSAYGHLGPFTELNLEEIAAQGNLAELVGQQLVQSLGWMEFASGTAQDPVSHLTSLGDATGEVRRSLFVFHRAGDTSQTDAVLQAQGKAVATGLGVTGQLAVTRVVAVEEWPEIRCPYATLVIVRTSNPT